MWRRLFLQDWILNNGLIVDKGESDFKIVNLIYFIIYEEDYYFRMVVIDF